MLVKWVGKNMYSVFALILGLSQLASLAVFPAVGKRMSRRKLYAIATGLVAAGYLLFFFSPMRMILIGAGGVLIFVGQAFIQILMLMFLADTVEYGQWKSGKRNESVTFSLQPFINKISGALANGILGVTLVVSGINSAQSKDDVSVGGIVILKTAMLLLPLAVIVLGFAVYLLKYKIDEKYYARIIGDLKERGDIRG
jgi:melibiose permease/lactose/raffinose/galactose permease